MLDKNNKQDVVIFADKRGLMLIGYYGIIIANLVTLLCFLGHLICGSDPEPLNR